MIVIEVDLLPDKLHELVMVVVLHGSAEGPGPKAVRDIADKVLSSIKNSDKQWPSPDFHDDGTVTGYVVSARNRGGDRAAQKVQTALHSHGYGCGIKRIESL